MNLARSLFKPLVARTPTAIALGLALLAAACSHGTSLLPAQPQGPSTLRGQGHGGGVKHPHAQSALVTIIVRVPNAPKIIPAGTAGMKISFSGPTTTSVTLGLLNASPGCQVIAGPATICTTTVTVPAGAYLVAACTYDEQPVGGVIPNGAHVLSKAKGIPFSVVAQNTANNRLSMTLYDVPKSLAISGLPPGTNIGTEFPQPLQLYVNAQGAANAWIVGKYQVPITLSDNDYSGITVIGTSGPDFPPADTLKSSTDVASLWYTGSRLLTPATITATAGAVTTQWQFIPSVQVTTSSDLNVGATPGQCPAGNNGDLRYAICNAANGQQILFNCGYCTIYLNAPLPPITHDLTIDGGELGNVYVDGNSLYRVFWVDSGTVTLANLYIQNGLARGGNGGFGKEGGGGGGAGLGGGLFIARNTAVVNVVNDYFYQDSAVGGTGGGANFDGCGGGGGGGGLGGNGGISGNGSGCSGTFGGGGGGGVLGSGGDSQSANGGNGGLGGGGGGGGGSGSCTHGTPGTGGAGFAGNNPGFSAGIPSYPNIGGNGAFGGGGGGACGGGPRYSGGNGGFGGGGGAGGAYDDAGGAGGPGGGGGDYGGAGGVLVGLHGGDGDSDGGGGGGGGAAAGPAIFVYSGTLTTTNSVQYGMSATAGPAGGGSSTAGTASSSPVYNYDGKVNGQTKHGPYTTALGHGN